MGAKGADDHGIVQRAAVFQLFARLAQGGGDRKTGNAIKVAIEPVAFQLADLRGHIQHRNRPVCCQGLDYSQGVFAVVGGGRDHNRHVMGGNLFGQGRIGAQIQGGQRDILAGDQKIQRRVGANIGRRRQRQHAQGGGDGFGAGRKHLMQLQRILLDGQARGLVAAQLGDDRQIHAQAGARLVVRDLVHHLSPQPEQVDALKSHAGQMGHAKPRHAGFFPGDFRKRKITHALASCEKG